MNWNTICVGDVCKYTTSGGTPRSSVTSYYEPPTVPWLKTKEVNYCRIYQTESYISQEGLDNSSAKLIPENSVIVAMYGQGDTAGRVAINKVPVSTNQACCNLIIEPEKADYEFVYYALSTLYEKLVSLKNGGAQPNLNAQIIRSVEIPFPPLETQHKIAAFLSAYDDLIENNQKQIKLLEEAAQRLYKEWFVDLRFPGHETIPIVDGVPEGWKSRAVSDFGEIITGKTPSTANSSYYGGNIPFVKIPDMHNRVYPITTEVCLSKEGAETQKNKYIPRNSIMVSCIATVGLVNITVAECQTNQQINSVVLYDEKNLYFLYFTLKQMKAHLDGVGSNGATMTNVNKAKFGKIEVLCPTEKLRKDFYNWCEPVFQKIENLSKNIIMLQQARDRLLPKLMNKEIEV